MIAVAALAVSIGSLATSVLFGIQSNQATERANELVENQQKQLAAVELVAVVPRVWLEPTEDGARLLGDAVLQNVGAGEARGCKTLLQHVRRRDLSPARWWPLQLEAAGAVWSVEGGAQHATSLDETIERKWYGRKPLIEVWFECMHPAGAISSSSFLELDLTRGTVDLSFQIRRAKPWPAEDRVRAQADEDD